MLKDKPYKTKILYLLTVFVLLLILSYSLAVKKTFQLKRICKDLKSKIGQVDNAPELISKLSARLNQIDDIVGTSLETKVDIQDLIIDEVSHYCQQQNINFRELPARHTFNEKDYLVETHIVRIQGGFKKLVKLLYLIENEYNLGRVSSTRFFTTKNIKTKRTELLLEIYIQNIKLNRNE